MGRNPPTHPTHEELLKHFQATYEAEFWYATLCWPNKKDNLKKKMEDNLKKNKKMENNLFFFWKTRMTNSKK